MGDDSGQSVQKIIYNLSDNARLIIGAIDYCNGSASSREVTSITGLGQKDLYYYMNSDNSLENKGVVEIERGSEEAGTRQAPNIWEFTEFGRRVASQGGAADEKELFDVIDFSTEKGELLQEDFEQMKEDFEQLNSKVNSILSMVTSGENTNDLDGFDVFSGQGEGDIDMLENEISSLEDDMRSLEAKLDRIQTSLQGYDARISDVESSVESVEEFVAELDEYIDEWTNWAEGEISSDSS